jgi:hypothetical protein
MRLNPLSLFQRVHLTRNSAEAAEDIEIPFADMWAACNVLGWQASSTFFGSSLAGSVRTTRALHIGSLCIPMTQLELSFQNCTAEYLLQFLDALRRGGGSW